MGRPGVPGRHARSPSCRRLSADAEQGAGQRRAARRTWPRSAPARRPGRPRGVRAVRRRRAEQKWADLDRKPPTSKSRTEPRAASYDAATSTASSPASPSWASPSSPTDSRRSPAGPTSSRALISPGDALMADARSAAPRMTPEIPAFVRRMDETRRLVAGAHPVRQRGVGRPGGARLLRWTRWRASRRPAARPCRWTRSISASTARPSPPRSRTRTACVFETVRRIVGPSTCPWSPRWTCTPTCRIAWSTRWTCSFPIARNPAHRHGRTRRGGRRRAARADAGRSEGGRSPTSACPSSRSAHAAADGAGHGALRRHRSSAPRRSPNDPRLVNVFGGGRLRLRGHAPRTA